jgi:peptidase E
MRKAFLLGGEDAVLRNSKLIMAMAFQDFTKPEVLVLPWASDKVGLLDQFRPILKNYLRDLGADKINFVNPDIGARRLESAMSTADMVYIPDGDSRTLMSHLVSNQVGPSLKSYAGIVVGNGAGSLVLCQSYTEGEGGKLQLRSGLGLVPIAIHVHYRPEQDESISPLAKENRIFTLPDGTALKWEPRGLSAIGNVVSFGWDGKTDPNSIYFSPGLKGASMSM